MSAVQVLFTSVWATALSFILLRHLFFCPPSYVPELQGANLLSCGSSCRVKLISVGRYGLLGWLLLVWWGQTARGGSALHWQDPAAQKDPGPSRSEYCRECYCAIGKEETWDQQCWALHLIWHSSTLFDSVAQSICNYILLSAASSISAH